MAVHLSKKNIHWHSFAWGLFSFCCLAILTYEFAKNTLIIADGLALSALTVGFLVHSFYPASPKSISKTPMPTHHKVIMSVCVIVFVMSFALRLGWL